MRVIIAAEFHAQMSSNRDTNYGESHCGDISMSFVALQCFLECYSLRYSLQAWLWAFQKIMWATRNCLLDSFFVLLEQRMIMDSSI